MARCIQSWGKKGVVLHEMLTDFIKTLKNYINLGIWCLTVSGWIGADPRTAVFTLAAPRGADVCVRNSSRRRCSCARLLRFHGGVQRNLVGERSEPIGGEPVSQRVRQLEFAEAVGHAIPPGLSTQEDVNNGSKIQSSQLQRHSAVEIVLGSSDILIGTTCFFK